MPRKKQIKCLGISSPDAPRVRLETEQDPSRRAYLEAKAQRGLWGRPDDVPQCIMHTGSGGCFRNTLHMGRTPIMVRVDDPKVGSKVVSGGAIGAYKSR